MCVIMIMMMRHTDLLLSFSWKVLNAPYCFVSMQARTRIFVADMQVSVPLKISLRKVRSHFIKSSKNQNLGGGEEGM